MTEAELVPATAAKRAEPPPEDASSIRIRRTILFSFWFVAIGLGLPLWLWTTSIHRADLPLQRMTDLAEGRSCQLHYPLNIHLNTTHTHSGSVKSLQGQLLEQLNSLPGFGLFHFHSTSADGGQITVSKDTSLTVNLLPNTKTNDHVSTLRSWEPILDVSYPDTTKDDVLVSRLTEEIAHIFAGEQQSLSHLLVNTAFATGKEADISPRWQIDLNARSTRMFKYASSYHLTFSLFASSHSPSAWEIERALEYYFQPLLASLSKVSKFTIDTQVQLHAAFSPSIAGPVYNEQTGQWLLQKSDLSGFINAAEWPLSPSIDKGPTINLVLYIPSQHQSPLVVQETSRNSWLIPQWGGVQILNRANTTSDDLSVEELGPVMALFAEQLTSLIGLPQVPSSFGLRIQSLTRERATSLILSASSTLGALARLTLKLTSIAIPDSVAKSVDETIHRLDRACDDLRAGRYAAALENARIAEEEAESAFFEPSMVGQVYFPDEHKVAVYVPLLGPMAVPLIMALIKELRSLRARKQKVA